jgi:hypothetical protein
LGQASGKAQDNCSDAFHYFSHKKNGLLQLVYFGPGFVGPVDEPLVPKFPKQYCLGNSIRYAKKLTWRAGGSRLRGEANRPVFAAVEAPRNPCGGICVGANARSLFQNRSDFTPDARAQNKAFSCIPFLVRPAVLKSTTVPSTVTRSAMPRTDPIDRYRQPTAD